nr:acyltransferase [Bacteroidales bacterium]
MIPSLRERIFNAGGSEDFPGLALEVFRHQAVNNPVYAEFILNLGLDYRSVSSVCEIPFLPAEIFKSREVVTGKGKAETVFESSSTTGSVPSRHYVTDLSLYEKSFLESFRMFYGDPSGYLIAALLPSYTEREGSSLVYMVSRLIEKSRVEGSAFYRGNEDGMIRILTGARDDGKKVLLVGVSFALLDLREGRVTDLSGITVMETGGMKGRRRE